MSNLSEALARVLAPCPATLGLDGTTVTCDIEHDARSGNPDESPHQHDFGNWQIRWDDWHCGHTVARPATTATTEPQGD